MRILKVHVYGFGKLHDKIISFEEPLQIIQGDNETGKSTVRAFIQAILFGFPTKKEKLLRYEPKTTGSYGGSITVQLLDGNTVVIERLVKNKAAGDVAIHMDNGETAGEEWLTALLGNMDRSVFQGIFCFGLDGLSEIHTLKGNDLNKYLYEAGMTGTRQVHFIEKELEDQLNYYFKAKGQKPIINQKLRQINHGRLELKKMESEFERYDLLLKEKEAAERLLHDLQVEKKLLLKEREYFQRKQTAARVVKEQLAVEESLKMLRQKPHVSEKRKEEWHVNGNKHKEAAASLQKAKHQINVIASKNAGLALSWNMLAVKEELLLLKEKVPLYQKLKEECSDKKSQLERKQKAAEEYMEKLGEDSEFWTRAVTNIHAETELTALVEQGKELKERRRILQEQKRQEEQQLLALDKDIAVLESQKRTLSEQKSRDERSLFEEQQMTDHVAKKKVPLFVQLLLIIMFVLGMWEWISRFSPLLALLTSLGLAAVLGWMLQKKGKLDQTAERDEEKVRIHRELVTEDQRMEASLKEQRWQRERIMNRCQLLGKQVEEERANQIDLENKLKDWASRYHFPSKPTLEYISPCYQLVKEWKVKRKEVHELEEEIAAMSQKTAVLDAEVTRIAERNGHPCFPSMEETLAHLMDVYNKEELLNNESIQTAARLENIFEHKHYWDKILNETAIKQASLLKTAGVNSEAEFLQAAETKEQHDEWMKKYQWLNEQIKAQTPRGKDMKTWRLELSEVKEGEWDNSIVDSKEKEEERLLRTLAEVNQHIQVIEEGGTYESQLQTFAEQTVDLENDVKKWLTLKTAQHLVRQAKMMYEKERQPDVIKKASTYFRHLTNGSYLRVFSPAGEKKFVVENEQGIRFSPQELSRGTAEQLYLALRLALAEIYTQSETFPLILDDPFVNFDRERQQIAFSLLKNISKERQIIYFTCHPLPDTCSLSQNIVWL
ncbi:ATP-binding protein [Bacillus piscicola]|uniref:ATP-binding protein n=1 Tax=Bacillus piscicola TaxID=1632684 RepID=UPI001F09FE4C